MNKSEYKIESFDENDDIDKCVKIIDSVLGKNYINSEQMLSMIKNKKFVCLKACVKEQLVGIAVGCVMNFDEAIKYLKIEEYDVSNIVKCRSQIAIIKTIAIDDNFQKIGIGSDLIRKLEKVFFDRNIHTVFTVAWRHGNVENIGPLMIKNAYKSLCIIERYYEKDSLEEGFSCPICGDHGCYCAANIYFKIV